MSRQPIAVCSLRDRGEPQARDVVVTRPGPWGNPFTVRDRDPRTGRPIGFRALDLYRAMLRDRLLAHPAMRARAIALAGARLLCACPADSLGCHAWVLAQEVDRLTGCGVEPAPERRRS